MAIPAYYSLIRRGSSGPDVALVQTWLNGIRDSCTWHAALTVDGTFGANAEKAVREFQLLLMKFMFVRVRPILNKIGRAHV